jgi:lactam utilization protein B
MRDIVVGLCAGLVALIAAPHGAFAQDAIAAPAQKTIGSPAKDAMIPSLAVINSRGASLQGNTLTMTGVSINSIVFADRPYRAAGHVLTKHFLNGMRAATALQRIPRMPRYRCSARKAIRSRTPSWS